MNVTALIKHPVMDLATATTIGRIDDVVLDAAGQRVVGFYLDKTPTKSTWLPWEQLSSLGVDAATVADGDVLLPVDDDAGRRLRGAKVLGGRVLTAEGSSLGTLTDVDIDPQTGRVQTLTVSSGLVLDGSCLLGIGSYATVVNAPGKAD